MAISKVSFFKTPQAADDYFYWTEDTLQQDTKVYNATTGYLTLDVMANDLGGNAKTLYSIDDGNGNPVNPVDLFNADTLTGGVSAWEPTADGNRARINNGKVEFDLSNELPGGVNSLGAGDQFTDTFIYAIRLGNGTLSWAHVHITIDGVNDDATITASAGEETTVVEAGGVANGTAGDPSASGQLTVNDLDAGENKFQTPASLGGTYGTFTFDEISGAWTYTLDQGKADKLAGGEAATDKLTVTSFDGTASYDIKIDITGSNDAPVAKDDTDSATEDAAIVNGSVATNDSDADAGAKLTYTLDAPVAGLTLNDDGTYSFDPSDDAYQHLAAGKSVDVVANYTVTDDKGATDAGTLTITITGVNDAPTITSNDGGDEASISIAENSSAVTTVVADDPDDGATVEYKISGGADSALFAIDKDSGALSFIAAPNFESPGDDGKDNVYDVVVQAWDGADGDTQLLHVTVTDENEAPTDIQLSASKIDENNAAGAVVATLTATDPDGALSGFAGPFTYKLVSGTGDTDNAAFSIVGDQLQINGSANFEAQSSYSIRVQVEDAAGLTFEEVQTITVNDVNEAPTLTVDATPVSVAENAPVLTVIGDVDGTDPDAGGGNDAANTFENLKYSIVSVDGLTSGAIYSLFAIDGVTGTVTLAGALDYETDASYSLVIKVADGPGLFDQQTLVVNVTDVAEADANDNDNDGLATKTTAGNGDNAANTLFGTTGGDDINGNGANDTIYGGAGNDTLNGNNDNDSIFGGSGNDVIDGGGGLDTIYGGSGNDQITGQTDADTIFGGSGDDTINGGGGTAADVLIGGYGADSLTGAGGSDTFKYLSTLDAGDVITDFDGAGGTGNQDYIDLDGLFDALGVLAAARAGRVDVSTGGSDGGGTFSNLRIDADGNGSFELTLAKVYTTDALTAGHEATPNNFDIQVGI
jgi:VCBS repeat-containing protein